jgi:hypothetical protein
MVFFLPYRRLSVSLGTVIRTKKEEQYGKKAVTGVGGTVNVLAEDFGFFSLVKYAVPTMCMMVLTGYIHL